MTPETVSLAALNVPLLEAIKAGGFASPGELAAKAGIGSNNVHRKLESLLAAGLIAKTGEATCDVALTEAGEKALDRLVHWDGDLDAAADGGEVLIPFDLIDAWDGNPRTYFDPATTEDMAQSIADYGVQEAITVRRKPGDRFEVIKGERRRRGSSLAVSRGWAPADFRVPCKIRDVTDEEAEKLAGVENIQREDMHWADLAKYFRRLMDDRRQAGPQLERLFGRKYSARKIQDYAKIARELAADVLEQAYLPPTIGDGDTAKPNPQCLTYTRARDMVGEKREKPALELSPKQRLALVELIHVAGPYWPTARETVARLGKPPSGGPLGQLADRKLIGWRFVDGKPAAVVALSEEVHAWLAQINYADDPDAALRAVRDEVLGPLHAGSIPPGDYANDELNAPVATVASGSEPQARPSDDQVFNASGSGPQARPSDEEAFASGSGSLEAIRPSAPEDDNEEQDTPPSPTEAASEPSRDNRPTDVPAGLEPDLPAPAQRQPDLPTELPPMLAIVIFEAAHKIFAQGVERGAGTWGVPVRVGYYKDSRGQQLVLSRMIAFLPNGEKTLVALGKAGRDWLFEKYDVREENGQAMVSDAILLGAQEELLGAALPEGGPLYSTPWLNPPAEAQAPAEDDAGFKALQEPTAEIGTPLPNPNRGDDFTQGILGLAAERRAKTALAAAARSAKGFIENLTTRSKAPKHEDVAPVVALLANALEAIAPFLDAEADQ